jgi:hypothetical protein
MAQTQLPAEGTDAAELTGEEAYATVMRHLASKAAKKKAAQDRRRPFVRRVGELNLAALPTEDIPLSTVPLRWVESAATRDGLPTLDGELRRGIRLAVDAAKRLSLTGQRAGLLDGAGVGVRR